MNKQKHSFFPFHKASAQKIEEKKIIYIFLNIFLFDIKYINETFVPYSCIFIFLSECDKLI